MSRLLRMDENLFRANGFFIMWNKEDIKELTKEVDPYTTYGDQWLLVANGFINQGLSKTKAIEEADKHIKYQRSANSGTQYGKHRFSAKIIEARVDEDKPLVMILKVLQGDDGNQFDGKTGNRTYYSGAVAEDLANHIPVGTKMFLGHPPDWENGEDHRDRLDVLTAVVAESWGSNSACYAKVEFVNPDTEWVFTAMKKYPDSIGVSVFGDAFMSFKEIDGQNYKVIEAWQGNVDSIDFVGEPAAGGKFITVAEELLPNKFEAFTEKVGEDLKIMDKHGQSSSEMTRKEQVEKVKKLVEGAATKVTEDLKVTYDFPDMDLVADFIIDIVNDDFFGANEKKGIIMDHIAFFLRGLGAHVHEGIQRGVQKKVQEQKIQNNGENQMDYSQLTIKDLEVNSSPVLQEMEKKVRDKVVEEQQNNTEIQDLKDKVAELTGKVEKAVEEKKDLQKELDERNKADVKKAVEEKVNTYLKTKHKDLDLTFGSLPSVARNHLETLDDDKEIEKVVEEVVGFKGSSKSESSKSTDLGNGEEVTDLIDPDTNGQQNTDKVAESLKQKGYPVSTFKDEKDLIFQMGGELKASNN